MLHGRRVADGNPSGDFHTFFRNDRKYRDSFYCFCPSPVADLLILPIPLKQIKVDCRRLFDTWLLLNVKQYLPNRCKIYRQELYNKDIIAFCLEESNRTPKDM